MHERELYEQLKTYNELLCCTSEFLTRLAVLMDDNNSTINKLSLTKIVEETLGGFCERNSNEQQ